MSSDKLKTKIMNEETTQSKLRLTDSEWKELVYEIMEVYFERKEDESDLDNYRSSIKRLVYGDINQTFFPNGHMHAAIVLGHIIRRPKKTLYIYSRSLNAKVFDQPECLDSLKFVLSKNLDFKIMLDDVDPDNKSEFYKTIKDKIEIKQAPPELSSILSEAFKGKDCHFTVADGVAHRVETDIKEHKAACNFNDSTIGKRLTEIFEYFWNE